MNKVTSYLKNVGKSVAFATVDVASKKLIPEVSEFTETNAELFKSVYATVSHSKRAINYGKKLAIDSQVYKDINKGINNALSDIKSGNFYNKQREQQAIDEVGEFMANGGGDFDDSDFGDFGDFDDFDDGSLDQFEDKPSKSASVSKGDLAIVDSVSKSTNLSAQLISKTVANTSKAIMNTSVATTNMVMAQNVELMAGLRTSIAGMHQSINGILEFAHKNITTQINNEAAYFSRSQELLEDNNRILREMLDIQKNMYKTPDKGKSSDQFGDIFSGGAIDLKEYFKVVGKNIKALDSTGTMDMMFDNSMGGTMLGQMLSNPLGGLMTGLIAGFMPKSLAKSIANFSKTLGGIFPSMLSKMNKWKEQDGFLGYLGKIFGIKSDTKRTIDTDKYNKGAVPFDGITRKAIVDVIPEHLSKIESLLSGQTQRIYDYDSGKWMITKDIQKKQKEEYERLIKDSFSDLDETINAYRDRLIKSKALSYEQLKQFDDDMMKMKTRTFEEGGHFSPRDFKKDIKNYNYTGFQSNEKLIIELLNALEKGPLSNIMSVSSKTFENKKRYGNFIRDAEESGTNIFRKLYDNSNTNSHLKYDENFKDEVVGMKTNSGIIGARDKLGKNALDYLRDITINLAYIRSGGASSGNAMSFEDYKNSYEKSHVPENIAKLKERQDKEESSFNSRNHDDTVDVINAILGAKSDSISKTKYNNLDEDEMSSFGKINKPLNDHITNKYEKIMDKIPGKNFGEKFKNAKSFKERYSLLLGSMYKVSKKPAEYLEGLINKANESIYHLLFEAEFDDLDDDERPPIDKRIKGLFGKALDNMQSAWTVMTETLTEKVIDPLVKKYGLEDKWNNFKEKLGNTSLGQRLKDAKIGISNALRSNVTSGMNYTKDALRDVASPIINDPIVADMRTGFQKAKISRVSGNLKKYLDSLDVKERQKIGLATDLKIAKTLNDNNIETKSYGGIYNGPDGTKIVIANENEDIFVANRDFKNQEKNAKKENKVAGKLKNYFKGIKINTKNTGGVETTSLDEINGMLKTIESSNKKINDINSNRNDSGPVEIMTTALVQEAHNIGNAMKDKMGLSDETKEKASKIKESVFTKIGSIFGEMRGTGYDTAAKALIGSGIGLFSGIVGGPLLGAAVGAGYSLLKNSTTAQKFLFGDQTIDEKTGMITEQKGGLINKNIQNTFKKYIPDMGKYGVAGAVSSLLLPFGPLAGAAIGAGIGIVKNSNTLNEMLFGDENGLFNKDRKEKIKKAFPLAGAGAIAGLFLGPFGILGNATLGAGIGLLTQTEEFRNLIFGEEDQNGNRLGGLKGALNEYFVNPIKEFGSNFKEDFFGFIKESMIDPLNRAITPIAEEISYQTKRVVFGIPKMFAKLGKDYIAVPFMEKLNQYFISPIANLTKKLFGGAFSKLKGAISLPFRAIGRLGDSARKKQIREGRDVSGNAKNRIQFAKDKKMGNYNYRAFDEALADNSDDEEYLTELTARTSSLAYGADYFEKQVKIAGKELSKVLTEYIKLGWLSKGGKSFKRIKKYIQNNDVESAIKELDKIKESKTSGGRLTDAESEEAIYNFTEANKKYQAAKLAREKFGNINKEENEKWMTEQFGNQWKKWDAKNLYKYSVSELSNINKDKKYENKFKPEQFITEGDKLINNTLKEIKTLMENAANGVFGNIKDTENYYSSVQSGIDKTKENRAHQKLKIRETLNNKGMQFGRDTNDIINLLYSNEKIYSLVLYVFKEYKITYDPDTIKKLCELKLSDDDLTLIKKFPYIAFASESVIKKSLNYSRNNYGTLFRNKATRDSNLDIMNDAISRGVYITDEKDISLTTSGGRGRKYEHTQRNKYYEKFNQLKLVNTKVDINGKEVTLTKDLILNVDKGLSFEQMDQIIQNNGGNTDDITEKTSVGSAIHNFSDKHLASPLKKVGKVAALGGLGLLASPLLLPLALGAGVVGAGKGLSFLGNKFKELKYLGPKGFLDNLNNKKEINDDYNEDERVHFTDEGAIKFERDDRGRWNESNDIETRETKQKLESKNNVFKSFMSTMTSMKDGIFGIFNHQKEKDEEEKKEPFLKRLFNFDMNGISSKLKFGGAILAAITGIGAIKDLWDNRTPGGLVDRIGTSVGNFTNSIFEKFKNWLSGQGEYENSGFPKWIEDSFIPNLFGGIDFIIGDVMPKVVESIIASLPALGKSIIKGIGKIFGVGNDHEDDTKGNINEFTTSDGNKIKIANSYSVGGDYTAKAAKYFNNSTNKSTTIDFNTGNKQQTSSTEISSDVEKIINGANIVDEGVNKEEILNNSNNTEITANPATGIINDNGKEIKNNINNNTSTGNQVEWKNTKLYKKDANGKLVPLYDSDVQNGINEFYTKSGVKYDVSDKGVIETENEGSSIENRDTLGSRIVQANAKKFIRGGSAIKVSKLFDNPVAKRIPGLSLFSKLATPVVKGIDSLASVGTNANKYMVNAYKKSIGKETAETVTKKATKEGVEKALKETAEKATEKTSKSMMSKISKFVKNSLESIFNNSLVKNKIMKSAKEAGEELTEKTFSKTVKSLISSIMKKFDDKILKGLGTKVLKKFSIKAGAFLASGGIINAIFAAKDFIWGFDQAQAILGVEDVTFLERLLSGTVNAVNEFITAGIIDSQTLVDWLAEPILALFGNSEAADDLEKRQKAADEKVEKYNVENGENLSKEEYFKRQTITGKIDKIGSDIINTLNPFNWFKDDKSKDKKEKATKNENKVKDSNLAKTNSAKKVDSEVSKLAKNNNINNIYDHTATGMLSSASVNSNNLVALNSNINTGYDIIDAQLGRAFGFTNSSGTRYVSLSKGIDEFNYNSATKVNKKSYKFSDIIGNISNTIGNLFNNTKKSTSTSKTKTTKSNKSSTKIDMGMGSGKDKEFISQLDPQYRNIKFNKAGDTEYQTLGDSGCGPATAANVVNLFSGQGSTMEDASKAALRYKDRNGGVTPEYFENYLGSKGIGTYSTMNKNEMVSSIASGKPTILLGSDPSNRANTPYGSVSSHYVLATGMDRNGNVIVQDPESRRPNSIYPMKDLIKQSHLGMVTGRASGKINQFKSSLRSKLIKLGFGRGSNTVNQDLATWSPLTADEINNIIRSIGSPNCGFSGHGDYFVKAANVSGLDPRYILAHAALESAWGNSSYAKAGNFFGIGAFDSNPDNAYNYGNDSMESGLVNGASWIRKNYYDAGQKTLYTMRFNNGVHQYATDPAWHTKIANIMDQMPKNTNAVYHDANGSAEGEDGSSTSNSLFDQLAQLPYKYFDKGLMDLIFGSSDSSSSESSESGSSSGSSLGSGIAKQFHDKYLGQRVDVDGAYGSQCVDLFSKFKIDHVDGSPSRGNAVDLWGNYKNGPSFKGLPYSEAQYGDWIIWGPGAETTSFGHVGMFMQRQGNGRVLTFGQNQGAGSNLTTGGPANETSISESGILGVLRATSGKGSGKNKDKIYNYITSINKPMKRMDKIPGLPANSPLLKTDPKIFVDGYKQGVEIDSMNGSLMSGKGSLPTLNLNSFKTEKQAGSMNEMSSISSSNGVERLINVIIDILSIIANNTSKLSDIVTLLSKSLDLNLTNDEISSLSSNNAQIKNKLANALKAQGSPTGLGSSIMNTNTETLANALYSIARA